jgi:methionyl-tRNA formyltransferase
VKIVLLCSGQHNQVALANKVTAGFNLAGIIIEQPLAKKVAAFSLAQLLEKLLDRTFFISLHRTWFNLLDAFKKEYPAFPDTQKITVQSINSEVSVDFIKRLQPDLIMVSGTSIVKTNILELPIPKGIINLHTGLSPYIKGGPNCTNWCLAEEKFHLIGNTIMWIDAGIDSGDIITTESTPLNGRETLFQLHMKVMNHAHDLYLKALKKIQEDHAHCPRVKQESIARGTTYYSRQWNRKKKRRLLKNLKKLPAYFQSAKYATDSSKIKTVPL